MKLCKLAAVSLTLFSFLVSSPVLAAVPGQDNQGQEMSPAGGKTDDMRERARAAERTVVAKVEGREINMLELVRMMNRVVQVEYPKTELTDEITDQVRQRALDRLIFEELALIEADKQGIEVDPAEVDKVIGKLIEAYGGEDGYQRYLAERGLTEENLRREIRRSRKLQAITAREVYQNVKPDEEDVEQLYQEYKEAGKLQKNAVYTIKEALVMAGQTDEKSRENAEDVLKRLKEKDYDFSKLTLDGTFIVRTIRVTPNRYPVIMEKMEEMEEGEFSGIVKEENGSYHIFKVLEKEPAREMTREEAVRILEDRLAYQAQEKRRDTWQAELRKGADIEILLDEAQKELEQKGGRVTTK